MEKEDLYIVFYIFIIKFFTKIRTYVKKVPKKINHVIMGCTKYKIIFYKLYICRIFIEESFKCHIMTEKHDDKNIKKYT